MLQILKRSRESQEQPSDFLHSQPNDATECPAYSMRPTVTLSVSDIRAVGHNKDNGSSFSLRYATIDLPTKSLALHQHTNLHGTEPVTLHIDISSKTGSTGVQLPEDISRRLHEYLVRGAPSQPFDCSSFVHYLLGVPHQLGEFDSNKWNFELLDNVSDSTPGQAVVIGNKDSELTHMAIYLEQGLYISKFGLGGALIIADLDNMKAGFGGEFAYKISYLGQK